MMESELSRGERTRAVIIDAAARQFISRGFSGASMRQIAQEAGIALGGIYNHFGSKEDLFTAVVAAKHPLNQIAPLLAEVEGRDAENLLREGARRILGVLEKDQSLLRLVFIELVEFDGQHVPALFEHLFPNVQAFVQKLLAMPGKFKPYAPMTLARVYFGMVLSQAMIDLLLRDLPLPEEGGSLDDIMDIFMHGALQTAESDD